MCRLKKALYGPKQAPRAWYRMIDEFFQKIGFIRNLSEANLYTFIHDGLMIFVVLDVDDVILTGNNPKD